MEYAKTRLEVRKKIIIFLAVIFGILFIDAMNKSLSAKEAINIEDESKITSVEKRKSFLKDFKGEVKYGNIKEKEYLKQSYIVENVAEEKVKTEEVKLDINTRSSSFNFDLNKEPEKLVGAPLSNYKSVPKNSIFLGTSTVISIKLDQDVMSDYLGTWRGIVDQDVYDTSNFHIVIPQGSRVIGDVLRISNINAAIQARMGMVVNEIVLPNNEVIQMKKNLSAQDKNGINGVKDKVDYHMMEKLLGVTSFAALGSAANYNNSLTRSYSGDVGEAVVSQGQSLVGRYLDLSPTITLNSGLPMKIFIDEMIVVKSWKFVYEN